MASRAVKTQQAPVQITMSDEFLFTCPCGSTEFKRTKDDAPLHLFCKCGQVYTTKDLEE